ncbi:MAG: ATP-binding cassette domain-containing protein, partial [Planctomycetes bacterium]|nr:ATP-binding cassette domain-containing protein [Planctomycetota bacterium]
ENLRLGGYLIRDRAVVKQRLADVFRRFPDLEAKRAVPAGLLSGGQLRMLEIGRFLMTDPRLVVLDEPSIGLAPLLVDFVYAQIGELRGEDRTFLIVEQNVRKLLSLADYVYALETGRNRYRGTPQRLVEEGHLAGLYLGLPGLGRVGASSP